MTEITSTVSLKNIFLFNSKYGQKEGEEEEKIIYFYPKETPADTKMKEVGLSEALVKFIENFSTHPCEALHTEKTKKIFYEPEENFWMIMTLNIPYGPRSKDVMDGMEYLGWEVKTPVYLAVLRQTYQLARLFHGPFQKIVDANEGNLKELKQRIEKFFGQYLSKLQSKVKDCDIVDLYQGIEYLGLDRPTFLFNECLVNQVEAKFPVFDYSLLLYDDKMIWSGLDPEDVQVLYRYLVSSLLPSSHIKSEKLLNSNISSYPPSLRFVIGHACTGKTRKVYLSKVREPGHYDLIVYRVNQATICLFSHSESHVSEDTLRNLDSFLHDKMRKMCENINAYNASRLQLSDRTGDLVDTRFIYFNSMNLATKETLHEKRLQQPPISKECLRILVEIHEHHLDLQRQGHKSSETLLKSLNDCWVVGLMSNSRQFYVTIERKKTSLLDVSSEMKTICEKQLKGIFFHI